MPVQWSGVRVNADLLSPIVDHGQPIHLDGLLALAWVRRHAHQVESLRGGAERARPGSEIQQPHLPLARLRYQGRQIWMASAALAEEPLAPAAVWQTKRRDPEDWDALARKVQVTAGPGKDYMLRRGGLSTPSLVWYAWGKAREVRRSLRLLWGREDSPHGAVGSARRAGTGQIRRWRVESVDITPADVLFDADGRLRRHIPRDWLTWVQVDHYGACEPPYYHPDRHQPTARVGTEAVLHDDVEAVLCSS